MIEESFEDSTMEKEGYFTDARGEDRSVSSIFKGSMHKAETRPDGSSRGQPSSFHKNSMNNKDDRRTISPLSPTTLNKNLELPEEHGLVDGVTRSAGDASPDHAAQQRSVQAEERASRAAASSPDKIPGSRGESDQNKGIEYKDDIHHCDGVGSRESPAAVTDAVSDLPSQLRKMWRGEPPARQQSLAILRDMLESRQEVDDILSTLVIEEVRT